MSDWTPTQIVALYDEFQRAFGSRYASKAADEMKLAAQFLERIGVLDAQQFLDDFCTTIGETIYLPYTPGVASERWPLKLQAKIALHEHVHVAQFRAGGWVYFGMGYLLRFEAEAFASEWDYDQWREGSVPEGHVILGRMGSLRHYGVSPPEMPTVFQLARQYGAAVHLGVASSAAAARGVEILERVAPELAHARRSPAPPRP
jgi:hypothetical protein